MKSKVTLSIDSAVVEEAKVQGINISAAAEQGISAFLGRSQHGKVQRGENGEFVMTEEVRKELESTYTHFEKYMDQVSTRYDRRKGMIWIYERAIRVGMEADELLTIFEERYSQHLSELSQTPKIKSSKEATTDLINIYATSFIAFVDTIVRKYLAEQDITDADIRSNVESASARWMEPRRKRLMNISREELYKILKARYNEDKGEAIL